MSLVLDGTLQTAQDGNLHNPIIEIISEPTVADIPFTGRILQETTTNETKPNVIMHSTGRICGIYVWGSGQTTTFKYIYTDVNRSAWSFVNITLPAWYYALEATLVEMANGNIGIVMYCKNYSAATEILRTVVLSPTGVVVDAQVDIYSVAAGSHILSTPFVIKLVSGNYYLAYIDFTVAGATYAIRYRTSTDFTSASWSVEGTCSPLGLTATKRIRNISLTQIPTPAGIWLWFDYLDTTVGANEMTNLYFSTSTNDGVTWATAVKHTNYTTYDTVGAHPITFQKVANQLYLVWNELSGVITKKETDADWPAHDVPGNKYAFIQKLHFDPVGRKLYALSSNPVNYRLYIIVRIDVDTWLIDKSWSNISTPKIPDSWVNGTTTAIPLLPFHCHCERDIFMVCNYVAGDRKILVLDGAADTVTEYIFEGASQNVDAPATPNIIGDTWFDYNTKRVYVYIYSSSYPNISYQVGYFTLTDTATVKVWTIVVATVTEAWWDVGGHGTAYRVVSAQSGLLIVPERDWCVLCFGQRQHAYATVHDDRDAGHLRIYLISDGTLYKDYVHTNASYVNFPCLGIGAGTKYINGKIIGTYPYEYNDAHYAAGPFNGLVIVNPDTDSIINPTPSYSPYNATLNYDMQEFIYNADGSLIMIIEHYMGIGVYDTIAATWLLLNNSNTPGLEYNSITTPYGFGPIVFDELEEMLYAGSADATYPAKRGIYGFSYLGLLSQVKYQIGTYAVGPGTWSWGTAATLILGTSEYDSVVCLQSSDKTMYCFWVDKNVNEYSIYWDKEGSTIDLTDYLVKGKEIIIPRSIDGSPASLSFSVSSGYLFDPHNTTSLFAIYLQKARKLTLRIGELVGVNEFWQNQSEFYVTETSLTYERLVHPIMEVKAEDIRAFWDGAIIMATEYYEAAPDTILIDLITTFTELVAGDILITTLDNSTTLHQQWVEVPLKDILDHIVGRYGYFLRIDANGKVTVKKISSTTAVSHIYSDTTKIINYSPDDSFSNFINQVLVIGESRDFISVLHKEEPIKTLSGTVGWWGGKKEIKVYYSDDRTRKCASPRLEVLLSVKSFNFKLGGGGESISSSDTTDYLYCVITINTPDLVAVVIGLIAAIVALGVAAVTCDYEYGKPGWCGIMMMALCSLLSVLMGIICSTANYSYQLYAQPYGSVKKTVQATWNDLVLQSKMGFTNVRKITEPLCYTLEDCQVVADHEGEVAQLQRSRIKISKVTHLQDEEGDIIQFVHPYSGMNMKMLITNITRRILIPEESNASMITMIDDIEGWKVP